MSIGHIDTKTCGRRWDAHVRGPDGRTKYLGRSGTYAEACAVMDRYWREQREAPRQGKWSVAARMRVAKLRRRRVHVRDKLMKFDGYPNLAKAAALTQPSLQATPTVLPIANRAGRPYFHSREYVHGDGARENPRERAAWERDEAVRQLREMQGLLERAEEAAQLALRKPYYASWTAVPSVDELKEIAETRRALEHFRAAFQTSLRRVADACEQLNVKLRARGVAGDIHRED